MNVVLVLPQACGFLPRYSQLTTPRPQRDTHTDRLSSDTTRLCYVRGRRPRISRDMSDRATIVSRGCRSWLGTCLDTPHAEVLGMNGAVWVPVTCLVVPLYRHNAATRHAREHLRSTFTFYTPHSFNVTSQSPPI